MILPQEFYQGDTTEVAKALLGKTLHINTQGKEHKARIVEVEAYLGIKDRAAHTFGGRNTPRVRSMYLDGGHAYVYMIYGMYYCLNFVTRTSEHPEAILLRAVEPMPLPKEFKKSQAKTNGPGKLCKFYGIDKEQDGVKLWKKNSPLFVSDDEAREVKKSQIAAKPRVGIDYAKEAVEWPLRFYLKDSLYVSKQ